MQQENNRKLTHELLFVPLSEFQGTSATLTRLEESQRRVMVEFCNLCKIYAL